MFCLFVQYAYEQIYIFVSVWIFISMGVQLMRELIAHAHADLHRPRVQPTTLADKERLFTRSFILHLAPGEYRTTVNVT